MAPTGSALLWSGLMVGEVRGQPERQKYQAGSLLLLGLRSFSLLVLGSKPRALCMLGQ